VIDVLVGWPATAGGLLLTTLTGLLAVPAAYLAGLTAAAAVARRRRPPAHVDRSSHRFAILIPAHNEEHLIGRLLESLQRLDYPAAGRDVYVVADNCEDGTAEIARSGGAVVYERHDPSAKSKGHALRWLLTRVRERGTPYDAFVVLDADSIVTPNLLRAMAARLAAGCQVIQAYYSVLNAGEAPVASLRYAALAAIHFVRPLGRSLFGLSAGLKGNGMCFAAAVLERYDWRWFTLAEDVEFHLALVADGIRVDFAPETTVLADMPVTLRQAASQNERWERGRLQLLRTYGRRLIGDGLRRLVTRRPGGTLRLDAAAEQLLPPLSVTFALGLCCLLAGGLLASPLPMLLALISLAGQLGHLIGGLILVGAPRRAYLSLAYAPVYVLWKVALYGRALVGGQSRSWVRTARTAGRA
jgi:1,2-diacylglycerol 3-beta-glucosyltransferase